MTKHNLSARVQKLLRIALQFLVGQGATQIITGLTGLFLVRWLSKDQYAQFSLSFQFQALASTIADLGVTTSLVALVGSKGADPAFVGRYTKAIYWLRTRIFWTTALGIGIFFYFETIRHPWSLWEKIGLFISVLIVIYTRGWNVYSAVLVIHHQMKPLYIPNITSGVARAIANFLLHLLGFLNGTVASLLNAAMIVYQGQYGMRAGKKYIQETAEVDPSAVQEVIRYVLPMIPGTLFSAFQGTVTIFIMSYFGNTSGIADISAMSRIGQFYLVLYAFNPIVLEPLIARQPVKRVPIAYFAVFGGAILLNAVIILLAYLGRNFVPLILTKTYANVQEEVIWAFFGYGISHLIVTTWIMNTARRWTFAWSTWANIIISLILIVICANTLNLHNTHAVFLFGIITPLGTLAVNLITGIWGMMYMPEGRQVTLAPPGTP